MGESDEVEEKERCRRCILNIGVMLGLVVFGFPSPNQTNVFTAESESSQGSAGLEDAAARAGR